jgi:hypothetical protein
MSHPIGSCSTTSSLSSVYNIDSDEQEEVALDSPANLPELKYDYENEVARLQKQVDEKDKIISNQSYAIKKQTDNNQELKVKLTKTEESLGDLRNELAEQETKVLELERDVLRYQQAGVRPELVEEPQNTQVVSNWTRFKGAVSVAGRFCYNNRRVFEGIGFVTGAILAFNFPQVAAPIILCVMGGLAIFDWVSSRFK